MNEHGTQIVRYFAATGFFTVLFVWCLYALWFRGWMENRSQRREYERLALPSRIVDQPTIPVAVEVARANLRVGDQHVSALRADAQEPPCPDDYERERRPPGKAFVIIDEKRKVFCRSPE